MGSFATPARRGRRKPATSASRPARRGQSRKPARRGNGTAGRRIVAACKFRLLDDLSASAVQRHLATLREGQPRQPIDPEKEAYKRAELAALLGVKPNAIPSLVQRHRLTATGNGRKRRYS